MDFGWKRVLGEKEWFSGNDVRIGKRKKKIFCEGCIETGTRWIIMNRIGECLE